MSDAIISVRMPDSLISELKVLAQKNHYLDLSDQLRTIVKQKCISLRTDATSTLPIAPSPKKTSESSFKKTPQLEPQTDEKQRLIRGLHLLLEELER